VRANPLYDGANGKEEYMFLLSWVLVGCAIGWSVGKALKGNGYGPVMDVVLGIGGAVAGGLLMQSAGLGGYGGTIITTLVAMIGAVLMTSLVGLANGRRMYARQL
jgi:uncharacterized membrane protein YeaQ/YmgE (transglycosylase-associated protein family)